MLDKLQKLWYGMKDRRSKSRPVSTFQKILDITFTTIRKTSEKFDCFKTK